VAADRPLPGGRGALVAGALLALVTGGTWTTNALGGEFVVPGLVVALGLGVFGVRRRDRLAGLLAVGFLPSAVVLAVVPAVTAGG
jgi:hypothetical protein